jgi:hypothetical protein
LKRLTMLILTLGLMASGCGSKGASSLGTAPPGTPGSPSPTSTLPPTTSPSPTKTPTSTPPPTSSGQTFTFEVWFTIGDRLFVTERTVPFTVAVGQAALDQLLSGPTAEEMEVGVRTAIPAGITSDITDLSGGVASVVFSPEFVQGTAAEITLRQAQVVYTLTQYATIDSVRFEQVLGPSLGRTDLEYLLPPILVESPIVGEQVSNPVTISGTANVFEATVSVRILDEKGNEIARTFTTATCGTGCRGDYSVSVSYSVDKEQPGTIEVLDYSAKDGLPENVITIPVILTP